MSRALWENQGHGDQTSSVLHLRPGSHRSPGGEQGQSVPPRKAPPFPSPPASELTPMTMSQYHAQGPRRVLLRRSACVFSPWDMCVPMLRAGSRGSDSEVHSRGLSGSVEVRLEKALLVPKRSGDVLKQQLCEGSSQWLGMGAEPPLMSGCPCQQPPLTAPSHCGSGVFLWLPFGHRGCPRPARDSSITSSRKPLAARDLGTLRPAVRLPGCLPSSVPRGEYQPFPGEAGGRVLGAPINEQTSLWSVVFQGTPLLPVCTQQSSRTLPWQ